MMNFNSYVFVDCETTGLSPRDDYLLEVTYAVGMDDPITLYVNDIKGILPYANPEALKVNQFLNRFACDDDTGKWIQVPWELAEGDPANQVYLSLPEPATDEQWDAFAAAIKDKYWVGAAPQFDYRFLEEYYHPEPLKPNHRLFDIQCYAAGKWNLPGPVSFKMIHSRVQQEIHDATGGTFDLIKPDHTSLNDVLATRQVWHYLVDPNGFIDSIS